MWSRGVILLLTLTAALAFERQVAKERATTYRVRSQNVHIDELEKEIHELEEEFEKLSDPVDDAEISRVKARVKKLSVNNCAKNEVSCGGDHPECVHNLLVCDGVKDCHNGLDEDDKVCQSEVVRAGSTFRGIVHWSSCENVGDHPTLITITASYRSSFFNPRAWVRATITNEVDGDIAHLRQTSYTARGHFSFATRRLVLIPDDNAPHNYGIGCAFTFGDDDHAACRIVQESSLNQCAKMRLTRG